MRRYLGGRNRGPGLLWIVVAVAAIFLLPQVQVRAENQKDDGGWSKPVVLFDQPGVIDSPLIVADQTGRLHVFWRLVHEYSGNEAIYYLRSDPILDRNSTANPHWSTPVLLQLRKQLGPPSVVVDSAGNIHLVFQSVGRILYTRVAADQAEDQGSWSTPVQLGKGQAGAQIALGTGSQLYLVYGGEKNAGVLLQTSPDGGVSWTAPQVITPPYNALSRVDDLRIAVESNMALHVAWSEFTSSNNRPAGVYYSRSVDGGKTWSPAFQLAGSGFTQVNLAYSAATGELHAAWNGAGAVKGRYYRRSANAGYLWQEVENITPVGTGGAEGSPQMVVDANGTLSLLTGEAGCAWYLERQNAWSSPLCFSQAETIAEPGLALLNGQLAAVFQEQNQSYYRLDFSLRLITAPVIATPAIEQPIATPTPSQTPQASPSSTFTPFPTETLAPTSTVTQTRATPPTSTAAAPTGTSPVSTAAPGSPEGTPANSARSLAGPTRLTPSVQPAETSTAALVQTLAISNTRSAQTQPLDTTQIILISLVPTLLALGILIASRVWRRNRPDY